MQSLFAYTNYRAFLRDFYEERKASQKGFSYQVLAERAGFRSRSYLIEVVAGKKPLSKNSILNLARAMGLRKKETEFFEALVRFNEARTTGDREFYFERMQALAGRSSRKLLGADQYEYFSKWHHAVVRELVSMPVFRGDFARLAKKVRPPISAREAEESVRLLLKLGLIQKLDSGRYRQTDAALATEDEVSSLAVVKYQSENLDLAKQALDKVPPAERDISTFTAGLSEEGFLAIKRELQNLRRNLAALADRDAGQDRVYQLNLQFFPVSQSEGRGEKK